MSIKDRKNNEFWEIEITSECLDSTQRYVALKNNEQLAVLSAVFVFVDIVVVFLNKKYKLNNGTDKESKSRVQPWRPVLLARLATICSLHLFDLTKTDDKSLKPYSLHSCPCSEFKSPACGLH